MGERGRAHRMSRQARLRRIGAGDRVAGRSGAAARVMEGLAHLRVSRGSGAVGGGGSTRLKRRS